MQEKSKTRTLDASNNIFRQIYCSLLVRINKIDRIKETLEILIARLTLPARAICRTAHFNIPERGLQHQTAKQSKASREKIRIYQVEI